jgi:hypothetical protein
MIFSLPKSTQRFALAAVGGRVDSPSKREKPEAKQMLKNARPTHRQLHALLGGVSERKTPCLPKTSAARLTKLLHVRLLFSTDKNHNLFEY